MKSLSVFCIVPEFAQPLLASVLIDRFVCCFVSSASSFCSRQTPTQAIVCDDDGETNEWIKMWLVTVGWFPMGKDERRISPNDGISSLQEIIRRCLYTSVRIHPRRRSAVSAYGRRVV